MQEKLPKEIRNRRRNIRKRAKLKLPKLVAKFGGKCHWCKRDIVAIRASGNSNYIKWTDSNGVEHLSLRASTDHVIRIADGGVNGDNRVASCKPCNAARQALHDCGDPTKGICHCGKLKSPYAHHCHSCLEKRQNDKREQAREAKRQILLTNGWVYYKETDRWQDSERGTFHTMDRALYFVRKNSKS